MIQSKIILAFNEEDSKDIVKIIKRWKVLQVTLEDKGFEELSIRIHNVGLKKNAKKN